MAKKNRIIMLCLSLVLVLSLSLAGMEVASAATKPATIAPTANITVDKLLKTATTGVWPAVTSFDFELASVGYSGGPATPNTVYNQSNLPMPTGDVGGVETLTASGFSAAAPGTTQTRTSGIAAINYTQMGVYTYKITEKIPTTPASGLVYDTVEYYINVYVQNVVDATTNTVVLGSNGQPLVSVSGISIYRGTNVADPANPTADTIVGQDQIGKQEFITPAGGTTVAVGVDMTNSYETKPMTVTKTVSGNIADTTQAFDFRVALVKPGTSTTDTVAYAYTIYNYGADGSAFTSDDTVASSGTLYNNGLIQLKHNQYFMIQGLPIGEKVTVTEQGATDYQTSITGVNGTVTAPSKTDVTSNKTLGQVIVANGNNTQSFVNKKEAVTPTGVWIDIMPYVLIAAVAVLGIVFFLVGKRRKKPTQKSASGL